MDMSPYEGARDVSIRAPAWGATVACLGRERERFVSIRAPAWGATRVCCTWRG